MACHLCILRDFTGGNAVISQGGLFVKEYGTGLGPYASLIINSVEFISVAFSVLYLQRRFGKRPLFLFSTFTLVILNFAVMGAMIAQNVIAIMIFLTIHISIYGGSLISLTWAYPSEVIPAR
jgi:hypothetical protein